MTETEDVLHAAELDEHGEPTGYALCDHGDPQAAQAGTGLLAVNNVHVNCEACLAELNGEQPSGDA